MKSVVFHMIACAALTCCGGPAVDAAGAAPPSGGAEMANPASTHCLEQGGRLEMMREEAGIFGVCVFEDGSRCEEWRYFRGECAPGDCTREDGRCQ